MYWTHEEEKEQPFNFVVQIVISTCNLTMDDLVNSCHIVMLIQFASNKKCAHLSKDGLQWMGNELLFLNYLIEKTSRNEHMTIL